MQIQLQRENLLKPVSVVAGVVERRQTLPILSYILFRVEDGKITLTGTDLEVEVVATAEGKVEGAGEFTVPARKLFDICRALPEGAVITLLKNGEKIALKAGKSRFSLSTLPPTDFPVIASGAFEQALTISQSALKNVLDRASFCMAQQDVRYYLNGLFLEISGKRLRAVATDGHRMAMTDIESPSDLSSGVDIIVPRKGIQEIARLLTNSDENVRVDIGANHIRLTFSDLIFTSKLIDGRFPDYTKVIPANQNKSIKLDRHAFREALSRVSILANEKYRGVRLSLETGRLSISAHNPEQEEALEELETTYSGESLEIGFNVNYLIEAASAISSPEIILGLNDPNSSCTLRAIDNENTRYIVMPMRL
ncbi:MAG: DNA polymerase III subunit beta [Gammaproteobacteria bacterium]|nr:DNA polymerase III subunit beta [Gammaproteobacteria bacterium]